jgi:hypothetical protein
VTCDDPSWVDPVAFNCAIESCLAADADRLRQQLVGVCGPSVIDLLDDLLRPRLIKMQVQVYEDPCDWSAVLRKRPSATTGLTDHSHHRRQQREHAMIALLIMFGPLLSWWSTATDVPVGLEETWWLVSRVIDRSEDDDVEEFPSFKKEERLRAVFTDSANIMSGDLDTVTAIIATLEESNLTERIKETIENVTQLIFAMGSTLLLDQLLYGTEP